jgi:hypothetical protein
MRMIRFPLPSEDLGHVVRRIVRELEDSHTYDGELIVTRVLPSGGASASTPAGHPHLLVVEERLAKLLGLIPYRSKQTILVVKEGFYDVEDTGSRDMFVVLRRWNCAAIVRRHLEEYGRRHHVTQVVYWGRNRFRPQCVVSL